MSSVKQKIGLRVTSLGVALRHIRGLVLLREYEREEEAERYFELQDERDELADIANKSLYMTAYLSMILAKNNIMMTDFDRHVLRDPPGLFGGDVPTLFEQVLADPAFLEKIFEDPAFLEKLIEDPSEDK